MSVDVYAFGCLLHELVTGNVPYPRENGIIPDNDPTPQPTPGTALWTGGHFSEILSKEVKELIEKMLQVNAHGEGQTD